MNQLGQASQAALASTRATFAQQILITQAQQRSTQGLREKTDRDRERDGVTASRYNQELTLDLDLDETTVHTQAAGKAVFGSSSASSSSRASGSGTFKNPHAGVLDVDEPFQVGSAAGLGTGTGLASPLSPVSAGTSGMDGGRSPFQFGGYSPQVREDGQNGNGTGNGGVSSLSREDVVLLKELRGVGGLSPIISANGRIARRFS